VLGDARIRTTPGIAPSVPGQREDLQMGSASLSRIRLYAPFLALIAVQAMLVAIAPSTAPGGDPAGFSSDGFEDGGGGQAVGEPGDADFDGGGSGDGSDGPTASGEGAAGGGGGGSAGGGGDGSGGNGGGDGDGGGNGGGQAASGDTSHCTDDDRQFDIGNLTSPECRPVFEGDNGGETHRGVTGDEIRVMWFAEEQNELVGEFLNRAGVGSTAAQQTAFLEAAQDFLNEHYETYGREIKIIRYEASDCPQTPPDIPSCRAEARQALADVDPFAVIWASGVYPGIFDEFARNQVLSLGGWHVAEQYFTGRRPFRWDLNMDGTKAGNYIAEYYCKKLAGDNPTHAGEVVHPSIGPRDGVERKLGILTQETEFNVAAANHVRQQIADCAGEEVTLVTYESDIERAQEQSNANTAAMIDGGVTTVVCMCDPIAPIFQTNTYTTQGYFPEHLVAGMGFMDNDNLARLYDQQQWENAFGLSHVGEPLPENEANAQDIWEAAGRDGERPCPCGLEAAYPMILGSMIHYAGPDLNPGTVERGLFEAPPAGGWELSGGDPTSVHINYEPGDYTTISDVREVHWDRARPSTGDGERGSYAPLYDGQRFLPGDLPGSFDVPN
jgi:hypothetical protein